MNTALSPKERFRKGYVLLLTIAYAAVFFVIIGRFFESLLIAAIFSGIVYPLYVWILKKVVGRRTLASLITLVIVSILIVVPLIGLIGLIAEQAFEVAEKVKPWLDQHLSESGINQRGLPSWIPFADKLEPYRDEIMSKLGVLAGKVGSFLASSLARLSGGTIEFFLQLFVMLYAIFYFLKSGPALLNKIMSYSPLSQTDKEKMMAVGLSVSRATVKGTLIIGVTQGTLGGIGFAVAGINAAAFWGAVMAVMSMIPGIGSALVWIPAVAYLMMTDQMLTGIGLLVYSAGVVGSIDNFLRPVLVGRDTEMPGLLILLSTLGGVALFGASGLVLGPILAALFMSVLAIYSHVFADWLNPDQPLENMPSDDHTSQSTRPPQNGG